MFDLDTLKSLRERVLAASGPDREIDDELALMEGWSFKKMKGDSRPYWRKPGVTQYFDRSETPKATASIDAALALVERMLPGTLWATGEMEEGPFARLVYPNARGDYLGSYCEQYAATAPSAILAALLSALIAQKEAA